MVRVRFAPSPTGALHIGGVRTALYNYLFAKKHNGTFLLRIEDTDQTRFVEGAEDYIIQALKWCGIAPTEGQGCGGGDYAPYRQSDRMAIYQQYAEQLIASGDAYYAFDSNEELAAIRQLYEAKKENFAYDAALRLTMRNSLTLPDAQVKALLTANTPHVIRFRVPDGDGSVVFQDTIRGEVKFAYKQLDDKVLVKGDGLPTYHLAHLVDDYLMRITHVIRGEEWLSSAPLHVLLYKALGWEAALPVFAHLPLIMRPDGKGKLSKRDGDRFGIPVFPLHFEHPVSGETSTGYDEKGFLPEAVVNFMALFGWSPGDDIELMTLSEMVDLFSMERINKAGAKFDYKKAVWVNQEYILKMDVAELTERARPFLAPHISDTPYNNTAYLTAFTRLFQARVPLLTDFWTQGYYCFTPINHFDTATLRKKWKPETAAVLTNLIAELQKINDFSAATIDATIHDFIAKHELKMGELMPILRIALTGVMQGPAVHEVAALLGESRTIERLQTAVTEFDTMVTNAL